MNLFVRLVFAIVLGFMCCVPSVYSQSSFLLVKKNGHYFTDATINDNANTPIFVETGFHGMVVSVEWYNRILATLPLKEIELQKEEYLAQAETPVHSFRVKC